MTITAKVDPKSIDSDMKALGRQIRTMIKDKILNIKITEKSETRRDKQNRLMWLWHNEWRVNRYETAGELFSTPQWHEVFKEQFIGTDDPVKINGKWEVRTKSTTDLKVGEFAELLTKYQIEAADMGCEFSQPDDLYWSALIKDVEHRAGALNT